MCRFSVQAQCCCCARGQSESKRQGQEAGAVEQGEPTVAGEVEQGKPTVAALKRTRDRRSTAWRRAKSEPTELLMNWTQERTWRKCLSVCEMGIITVGSTGTVHTLGLWGTVFPAPPLTSRGTCSTMGSYVISCVSVSNITICC